jgi:hypothetical protein
VPFFDPRDKFTGPIEKYEEKMKAIMEKSETRCY